MRPFIRSVACSLVLVVAPVMQAVQAQIVDQSQLMATTVGRSANRVGQTFTPTESNVIGAGAFISTSTGRAFFDAVLTVELWSGGVANSREAKLIASGTQAYTLARGTSSWVDAFWSSAVTVTPGTTYFLAFGSSGDAARFGYRGTGASVSAYGAGDMYRGSSIRSDAQYNRVREGDLAFREFSVKPDVAVVTPEPATGVLLATGLIGIVGVARRRKAVTNA